MLNWKSPSIQYFEYYDAIVYQAGILSAIMYETLPLNLWNSAGLYVCFYIYRLGFCKLTNQ